MHKLGKKLYAEDDLKLMIGTRRSEGFPCQTTDNELQGNKKAKIGKREQKAVFIEFDVNQEDDYMPPKKGRSNSKLPPVAKQRAQTKSDIHPDIDDDDSRMESSRRRKINWKELAVLGDFSKKNPSWDEMGLRLLFSKAESEILQPSKGFSSISEAIVESKLRILAALFKKKCEEVSQDKDKVDINGKTLNDSPDVSSKHLRLMQRKRKFNAWLACSSFLEREIVEGMIARRDLNDIFGDTGFLCKCMDPFCFEPPKCGQQL